MYNPQLKTFLQVADAGSFNRAAEKLYITPPAVIKQINALEHSLGLQLFERSHRGLTLTPAGEVLYKEAGYMIDYGRQALERARQAMKLEHKVIRIGVSLMTKNQFTVEQWFRIQALCPDLSFKWVPFTSPTRHESGELQQLLKNIDFIAGMVDPKRFRENGFQSLIISQEPLRVAVALKHPLAQKKQLKVEDLYGQRLLFSREGWNQAIDAVRWELHRNHPQIDVEVCDGYNIGIFNQCAEGDCLVTAIDAWRDLHPMVQIKPVSWSYTVPYGLMYAMEPSKTMEYFLEAFQTVMNLDQSGS